MPCIDHDLDLGTVTQTISGLAHVSNHFPLSDEDRYKLLVVLGMLMEIEIGLYFD